MIAGVMPVPGWGTPSGKSSHAPAVSAVSVGTAVASPFVVGDAVSGGTSGTKLGLGVVSAVRTPSFAPGAASTAVRSW